MTTRSPARKDSNHRHMDLGTLCGGSSRRLPDPDDAWMNQPDSIFPEGKFQDLVKTAKISAMEMRKCHAHCLLLFEVWRRLGSQGCRSLMHFETSLRGTESRGDWLFGLVHYCCVGGWMKL